MPVAHRWPKPEKGFRRFVRKTTPRIWSIFPLGTTSVVYLAGLGSSFIEIDAGEIREPVGELPEILDGHIVNERGDRFGRSDPGGERALGNSDYCCLGLQPGLFGFLSFQSSPLGCLDLQLGP